jgi:hypothetical protein
MSSHFANSESTTHPCPRDEAGQISCPTWASQPPADILIDETLSYMFGSRVSEWYFEHLLKGRIRKSLLRLDLPGWSGACFICQAQAPELETPPIHREPRRQPALQARPLDYDVRSLGGTVVPQALWSPHGKNATKKYVLDATLQWPVFFVREDRTVGIPLQEAVEGQCPALLGAKTHAPLGGRCTLHVRIKVSTTWSIGGSIPLSTSLSDATTLPGPPPRSVLIASYHSGPVMGYGHASARRATTRIGGIL